MKLFRRIKNYFSKSTKYIPTRLNLPEIVDVSYGIVKFQCVETKEQLELEADDEVYGFCTLNKKPQRFKLKRFAGKNPWYFVSLNSPDRYRISEFAWIEK